VKEHIAAYIRKEDITTLPWLFSLFLDKVVEALALIQLE